MMIFMGGIFTVISSAILLVLSVVVIMAFYDTEDKDDEDEETEGEVRLMIKGKSA